MLDDRHRDAARLARAGRAEGEHRRAQHVVIEAEVAGGRGRVVAWVGHDPAEQELALGDVVYGLPRPRQVAHSAAMQGREPAAGAQVAGEPDCQLLGFFGQREGVGDPRLVHVRDGVRLVPQVAQLFPGLRVERLEPRAGQRRPGGEPGFGGEHAARAPTAADDAPAGGHPVPSR